jgi:hypothetical protein
METFTSVRSCRICGNTELAPILSLGEQCLTGVFPRDTAEKVTRGPLTLVKCQGGSDSCGLVQLAHSYSSREMYGPNYGYRSSLNKSMVEHLRGTVARLHEVVPLDDGDLVLDIGSNDGTTLSFFPDHIQRVGIDPTAAKFREFYAPGIHVIPDFFTARLFDSAFGGQKAKIVTSIAMLYDLENPLAFAKEVESILADDGVWHFEQSYMPLMLANLGYDTICHEHVEYYSLTQISWILERSGLRILDVTLNDVNGGSFAVTVCKESASLPALSDNAADILGAEKSSGIVTLEPYTNFARRVTQHRDRLPERLKALRDEGLSILGYGASTKGNVILQYCGIGSDLVPYFAEVNPDKFGAFTPGSLIPIISEDDARRMNPDLFLAMPWHFRANLLEREKSFLANGGRMIFPLPDIEIVAGAHI